MAAAAITVRCVKKTIRRFLPPVRYSIATHQGLHAAVAAARKQELLWFPAAPGTAPDDMLPLAVQRLQERHPGRRLTISSSLDGVRTCRAVAWKRDDRATAWVKALLHADARFRAFQKNTFRVACDGSFDSTRARGCWGWVRAGKSDTVTVQVGPAGSPAECEMRAALSGLSSAPQGANVELLIDFRPLVSFINEVSRGGDGSWPSRRKSSTIDALCAELAQQCQTRRVLATWVPGHRGHGLMSKVDQETRSRMRAERRLALEPA